MTMVVETAADSFTGSQGIKNTVFTGTVTAFDSVSGPTYGWGPVGLTPQSESGWVGFDSGGMYYLEIVQSGYVTFPQSSTSAAIRTQEGGIVVLGTDGSFTYTSPDGFVGSDFFTYAIYDSSLNVIETKTVWLDVKEAVGFDYNIRPDIGLDIYEVKVDAGSKYYSEVSLKHNDSDKPGDSLSVVATTKLTALGGIVSIYSSGDFVYTPPNSMPADGVTDTFAYTVKDSYGATRTGTVTLNVNKPSANPPPVDETPVDETPPDEEVQPLNTAPVASDYAVSLNHGSSLDLLIKTKVEDADGDPLTITFRAPTGALGSITTDADGNYSFVATRNKLGSEDFVYEVDDGKGGIDTAVLTVNVVNEGPVAVADEFIADYGKSALGNVLANDDDPEKDTLSTDETPVDANSVSVKGEWMRPTENGFFSIKADGEFKFTPRFGFYGTETIEYTVTDSLGASATGVITVIINPPAYLQNGTANADTLNGTGVSNDDTIFGRGGKDVVSGNDGNDTLFGGDADDTLYGGNGADILDGGSGVDKSYGGAGSDTFVLRKNVGTTSYDKLMDFKAEDQLAIIATDLGLDPATVLDASYLGTLKSATVNHARFIYDSGARQILWDADGNAATANVVLASLANRVSLTIADFELM